MKTRKEKLFGLLVLLIIYAVAVAAGVLLFRILEGKMHILNVLLLCDILATQTSATTMQASTS